MGSRIEEFTNTVFEKGIINFMDAYSFYEFTGIILNALLGLKLPTVPICVTCVDDLVVPTTMTS